MACPPGGPHDMALSFVATAYENIIGSVRMTPVTIGPARALLLGPIVVSPNYKNAGVGSRLMNMALDEDRKAEQQLVILVRDEPYYRRFGFRHVSAGRIIMPAPVKPRPPACIRTDPRLPCRCQRALYCIR